MSLKIKILRTLVLLILASITGCMQLGSKPFSSPENASFCMSDGEKGFEIEVDRVRCYIYFGELQAAYYQIQKAEQILQGDYSIPPSSAAPKMLAIYGLYVADYLGYENLAAEYYKMLAEMSLSRDFAMFQYLCFYQIKYGSDEHAINNQCAGGGERPGSPPILSAGAWLIAGDSPKFDKRDLSRGKQDVVSVKFSIGCDGRPLDISIEVSRDDNYFGESVYKSIASRRYLPEVELGSCVEGSRIENFTFSLEHRDPR